MFVDTQHQAAAIAEPRGGLSFVDLDRYPIHRADHPSLQTAIIHARTGLAQEGCARLAGFIKPGAVDALSRETTDLSHFALHSSTEYTPYGSGQDDRFPIKHPRRRGHLTTSGSVTRDLIPADALIQQIYTNPHMINFVAACLKTERLHLFADPMRGLIVNSMDEGNTLGWHFDANEFTVSLMTRRADRGGLFEYCPDIRRPGAENFGAVQGVLDGQRELVKVLDLQVGDLQIFKGRYALHRVGKIDKGTRHTVIFGYAREPGFIGSVASTMKIYGRVMQGHIDAEATRHSDGLAD